MPLPEPAGCAVPERPARLWPPADCSGDCPQFLHWPRLLRCGRNSQQGLWHTQAASAGRKRKAGDSRQLLQPVEQAESGEPPDRHQERALRRSAKRAWRPGHRNAGPVQFLTLSGNAVLLRRAAAGAKYEAANESSHTPGS